MIHVGYILRGIPGAIVTGVCFIGPAFLLTMALSVLYVTTGAIPQIESILWGIKPVIVAIIFVSVLPLLYEFWKARNASAKAKAAEQRP